MNLYNWVVGVGLLWSATVLNWIAAYPTLAMPHFHRAVDGKSIDLGFPKVDDDVLQLELLREMREGQQPSYHQQKKDEFVVDEAPPAVSGEDNTNTQPELEQQLEAAATETTPVPPTAPVEAPKDSQTAAGAEQSAAGSVVGIHRPPHLQANDGGKTEGNAANGDKAKAAAKCRLGMHGAARLMYGQNPEALPTTSTTSPPITRTLKTISTSSTTSSTSTKISVPAQKEAEEEIEEKENENKEEIEVEAEAADTENKEAAELNTDSDDEQQTTTVSHDPPQLHPMRPMKTERKVQREEEPPRQLIGDVVVDESVLRRPAASRRSVPMATAMSPKMAENLLKRVNGQYSSFDMAQYIFWTGDENGVARAVNELIQNDLMTREEALQFLREIRLGLNYLQKSYANRVFPEEIHHNTIKKSHIPSSTTTTTTTITTTPPKPFIPYLNIEQNLDEPQHSNLGKTLESIALWHKLQAMNNGRRWDFSELGDAADLKHIKISDCQDKKYNLEEIIYKLARITFFQSLSHNSNEAQKEIEKLMEFLEREHELGVISGNMEKKVLHVLLQALSDTLTEQPDLWPNAEYLYKRLLRSYAHINFIGSADNISI